MSGRLNIPITGICSFAKYPICTDLDALEADVAVLGVPYDMGAAYRPGARMAPRGVREASTLYGRGGLPLYDPEKDDYYLGDPWRIIDCGDVDMVHGDREKCFANIEEDVRKIVGRGAIPAVIGGDHSITIPVLKALDSLGPICVVQIDAHLDWSDNPGGQKYGQGSPLRRASELPHITAMAQLGIRGLGSSTREDFADARAFGSVLMFPSQMREIGMAEVVQKIPAAEKYFITLDIDGLDPSIAPGTGTPAPGGLYYEELKTIFELLAKKGEIIGFDVVEVAPPYDPSGITSQVAARLMMDLISFITKEKEKTKP